MELPSLHYFKEAMPQKEEHTWTEALRSSLVSHLEYIEHTQNYSDEKEFTFFPSRILALLGC
jgi:hypothetical protein